MRAENFSWVSFLCLLYACAVSAQAAKALPPTQEEYDKWATISNGEFSQSASWVSYHLSYPRGKDTLFVKNRLSGKIVALPGHYSGKFIGDDYFHSLSPSGNFITLNLNTTIKQEVHDINAFEMLSNEKSLMLVSKKASGASAIEFRKPDGSLSRRIDGIKAFRISPDRNAIVINRVTLNEISAEIISTQDIHNSVPIASAPSGSFDNLTWQRHGKAVAFVYRSNEKAIPESLTLYNLKTKKSNVLNSEALAPFNRKIEARYVNNLVISDDLQNVLFTTANSLSTIIETKQIPQIWNACDTQLESNRALDISYPLYWFCWQPKTAKIFELQVGDLHSLQILAGGKFALAYSNNAYKSSHRRENYRDIHRVDLSNGKTNLLITGQPDGVNQLMPSPNGNFLAHYRDGKQYITNIITGQDICLNAFDKLNINRDILNFVAWEQNEMAVLLSDETDIWKINPDGTNLQKLTENPSLIKFSLDTRAGIVSFAEPILLRARTDDYQQTGYFLTDTYGILRQLIFTDKKITELKLFENAKSFSYLEEDFTAPPALKIRNDKEVSLVVQSNPIFTKYKWGKSELIEYQGNYKKLKGVLCYPFDYDPSKTYPMLVLIYEKQNYRLHEFVNPTLLNPAAFNTIYYTSRNYFVLFPDIDYVIGEPGYSAAYCVVNATQAALQKVPVDPRKLGLMGHSFGGYETNFIITQTNLFATAVSGAGVSDLITCFLSENAASHNTNFWRFEEDQMRMGKSLFEDYEGYIENSPVTHASKIETPLLLNVGQNDFQVGVSQSMELHLALRRLQKENVLLIYPNQGHVFSDSSSQIDATLKAGEWFDHFLKDAPKPSWSYPK